MVGVYFLLRLIEILMERCKFLKSYSFEYLDKDLWLDKFGK